ncbi:2,3-bisphosphoglycerate-independent phosphoglycerate mutase [Patescibacteria group bacterium]
MDTKPTILIVLDGWGLSNQKEGNAVSAAKTPYLDFIKENYPMTELEACCEEVGLPPGVMGNSEVGHMNMGAGRVVPQDVTLINSAIESKAFFSNPALLASMEHVRQHNSKLHLVGMVSDGLVHSDIKILYALLDMCRQQEIKQVYIHAITDGIDVDKRSALNYIKELDKHIKKSGVGQIVTVTGRYYAMDRAHNYDRTAKAYHAMVHGIGPYEKTAEKAIERAYEYGINDDMIEPTVISDSYIPKALVGKGDSFIFFNLRSDRTRQLSKPFVLHKFDFFDRGKHIEDLNFTGMTNFGDDLPMAIAYMDTRLVNALPEVFGAIEKIPQLYIAEEEKFSQVAYFFHGGSSQQYDLEERIMVPSKKVKSYDELPEMSAAEVTDNILEDLAKQKSKFIMVNFANPDIVGHTGNFKATIKALEFLDPKIKAICEAATKQGGLCIVTSDHGNCEEMLDSETQVPLRKHATNPVPFILVSDDTAIKSLNLQKGILGDVAPTILKLMNYNIPKEMTSKPLY